MNYRKVLFTLGASAILLAACGNNEKESEEKSSGKIELGETEETSEVDGALAELRAALEEREPSDESVVQDDSEVLNPNIAEMTEGDVEVLYTNKAPGYVHDMDGFVVTIDEYQITKVSDVNRDSEYLFKGSLEGYVVTALATYENKRSNPVYYSGYTSLSIDDRLGVVHGDKFSLVPREEVLNSEDLANRNKYLPGVKKQDFISFIMTSEQYKKMKKTDPKFTIGRGASEREDMLEDFPEDAIYDFIYSAKNAESVAAGPTFYRDDLTRRNMADKTMIFEKNDIGQKLELGSVGVTLEGVQYTKIEPADQYQYIFGSFADDRIVALTVKLTIDNKSDETLSLSSIRSTLSVDDNEYKYSNHGSLEPERLRTLKPGESGEKYHVFLLEKSQFDNHKKFELLFGPFVGEDGKKLFDESNVLFTLPR
ncbi:DUF5068 domain-containing protein [Sporosarcina sp. FSL K6-1522]|uniref:DUF5068 domain-containing protein n=1 Tax=Sporosarcina sp. FSL K6-1522 TaxID=2921554 RepID=UPI003159CF29